MRLCATFESVNFFCSKCAGTGRSRKKSGGNWTSDVDEEGGRSSTKKDEREGESTAGREGGKMYTAGRKGDRLQAERERGTSRRKYIMETWVREKLEYEM